MAGFSKKKYFALAKGFMGRAKNCFRITVTRVQKSLQKAYVGRKLRKRNLRRNWIANINTATRDLDLSYSSFICGLNRSNIVLDRKILSQIAQTEPYSFKAVVDEIKIQNEIMAKKRYYKLDEMIKRNLITSAIYAPEAYKIRSNEDLQMEKIIDENLQPIPLEELFPTKKA